MNRGARGRAKCSEFNTVDGNQSNGWLIWLSFSRMIVSLSFMTYAGALPALSIAWHMTAVEAGLIQTVFNVSYAVSLVVTGWMSDRIGARRVFLLSSALTALAGLLVAVFARSFESAILLFALFGAFHGGTYTPSIMLVAQGAQPRRRGLAIGLLLAGASLGYAGSIAISSALSSIESYRSAFAICGIVPVFAAYAGWIGVRKLESQAPSLETTTPIDLRPRTKKGSLLLTLGYTAHCWELLGMWAWLPAFLVSALTASTTTSALTQGIWIGVAIHISGCVSAFTMGHASDRLGRRAVLVALGLLGAICSMGIGWFDHASPALVLVFAAVYGFSALGDSPVLSTAIAEAVSPDVLGAALAIRSILGFGAGGLAPLAFGAAKDLYASNHGWVAGFSCLSIGGLLAALFALALPSAHFGRQTNKSTAIKKVMEQ